MGRGKKRVANPQSRKGLWARRISAFFGVLAAVLFAGAIAGVLYAGTRLKQAVKDLPSADRLSHESLGGSIKVYSTDNVLLGERFKSYRAHTDFKDLPKAMVQATIAIEDERFYEHPGIDLKGVVRALYKNLQAGRQSEGASTLTQQLVKNVILQDTRKTIDRKLQEAILAYQVERTFTKDQILERYLNEINYGGQIFGVTMAAKLYFGKSLKELTIGEAALIAGIVKQPPAYEPFKHFEAALERRNIVLGKMRDQGFITQAQFEAEKARKITVMKGLPRTDGQVKAPHFFRYVLSQLSSRLQDSELIERGGLRVYTTLNYAMQQQAEEILQKGVRAERGNGVTEGALVCVEPHTGWIRTMVGAVDFEKEEYNFAAMGGRQPGSTFKPIVYAAAFEYDKKRYDPYSTLRDSKITNLPGGYSPKNYGGNYSNADISIIEAIATSKNTIPVKLAKLIGIKNVIKMAKTLGITASIPPEYSVPLGTADISPLEMTIAYCTFANGGDRVDPMAIRLIRDGEGNIIEENQPGIYKSVLTESTAADISKCLAAVVDHGTGQAAKSIEGAHGKTGTTSDNKDAWFIGYTKELVAAVWLCNKRQTPRKDANNKPIFGDDGKPVMRVEYKEMDSNVTGGHFSTPLWTKFMAVAVPIQRSAGLEKLPLPDAVVGQRAASHQAALTDSSSAGRTADDAVPVAEETPKPERKRKKKRRTTPTPSPDGTTPDPGEALAREPITTREPAAPREREQETITICAETSKRASSYCPETIEKRFPAGTRVPTCKVHHARSDDKPANEAQ
jgi:penicillin-binding protein 1A